MLAFVSSAALLGGCVELSAVELGLEVRSTVCGDETWVDGDGHIVHDTEVYRFAVLDADLAAHPEVAAAIGFSQVGSCEEARTASRALLAREESVPIDAGVAPAPGETPAPEESDAKGEDQQSLMGPIYRTKRGVIEFPTIGCTGFLANSHVAVTAAHCIDQFIESGDSGTAPMIVRYFDPTVGHKVEITEGFDDLAVFVHPNWSGSDDPNDDLGLVVRGTPWLNTTAEDYLRIYDDHFGKVGTVRAFGRGASALDGTGEGVLRSATFGIDWYNSWYSITLATETRRICRGDSGGPAIKRVPGNPGLDLVTGVHSSVDGPAGSYCARNGGNQRHTRLIPNKIEWLENVTGSSCPRFSRDGIQYARCW